MVDESWRFSTLFPWTNFDISLSKRLNVYRLYFPCAEFFHALETSFSNKRITTCAFWCPDYGNYQLHVTDFYLNLTLRDEFHASNIVFVFHFVQWCFIFQAVYYLYTFKAKNSDKSMTQRTLLSLVSFINSGRTKGRCPKKNKELIVV